MSAQVFEIIFWVLVAVVILHKLVSTLGTDEDGATSFFGENNNIKNVTNSISNNNSEVVSLKDFKQQIINKTKGFSLKGMVVKDHEEEVKSSLKDIMAKMPDLELKKFLRGARLAFGIIVDAASKKKKEEWTDLVDKRFYNQFEEMSDQYGKYNADKVEKMDVLLSEVYTFGNDVFMKVLFSGKGLIKGVKSFNEEWTFTKSVLNSDKNWYLSNIDRPSQIIILMKFILIYFIKFYQFFISPWLGNNCKYYPTCSSYGIESIKTYGAFKGILLTLYRVLRCNPFSKGGYDPVNKN